MALAQMMPYHLVPQREAMLVQQQQRQSEEAGLGLPTRMTPGQQVRQFGLHLAGMWTVEVVVWRNWKRLCYIDVALRTIHK